MTTVTQVATLQLWREPAPGRIADDQLARVRTELVKAVARICPGWLANDREDIVQAALVKLMESTARSGGDPGFSRAYLRRVAYTHVVDEIRRRRRRSESPLETVEEVTTVLATPEPDPETTSASGELGDAIRGCLREMAEPRRAAVTLWLLGYGHKEIARRLGWNRKRAENLVTRGRTNLREGLASRGFGP